MVRVSHLLFLVLIHSLATAQPFKPESPLSIPLKLAGTFGELRSAHFHSGIDLRTFAREGYPVKNISGGYIARLKVSASGFGKAVYVHHPEGFTSVYAHLHCFNDSLEVLADSLQRAGEVYEFDFQPDSTRYPVSKGKLLGLSGNTGGSEGPHLHFEIRDRFSEEPLNPLAFGLPVTDTIAPLIRNVSAYHYGNGKWIRFMDEVKGDTLITAYDTIGFAVFSTDPDSNASLGIYHAELKLNDSVLFRFNMDRFNFNETRYVNAHTDYDLWNKSRQRVHRLFRLKGDAFSVFKNAGEGKIPTSIKGSVVILGVKDFSGNTGERKLFILKKDTVSAAGEINEKDLFVRHDSSFTYTKGRNTFKSVPGTFYQDEYLTPFTVKKVKRAQYITEPVGFNNPGIPVHVPIEVSIRLTDKMRRINAEKVIIAETDSLGVIRNVHKPFVKANVATVRVRKAGIYAAGLDLSAPEPGSYRLWNDTITGKLFLKLKIKDDLSGIGVIRVLQNNSWQPAMYEPRTGEIVIQLKREFPSFIDISVSDVCGNVIALSFGL